MTGSQQQNTCARSAAKDVAAGTLSAQQKLPPAADFQFFAALAAPLLAALQAPTAAAGAAANQPVDARAAEDRKREKRRRTADGAVAPPQQAVGGSSWAGLARSAPVLPQTPPRTGDSCDLDVAKTALGACESSRRRHALVVCAADPEVVAALKAARACIKP